MKSKGSFVLVLGMVSIFLGKVHGDLIEDGFKNIWNRNLRSGNQTQVKEQSIKEDKLFSWNYYQLPHSINLAEIEKARKDAKNKEYTEKDIDDFFWNMSSSQEIENYKKLLEAGKKYVLLFFFKPSEAKNLIQNIKTFCSIFDWRLIGITCRGDGQEYIPEIRKGFEISNKMGLKTFPCLIMVNLKNGRYRQIKEEDVPNYFLEDRILEILQEENTKR